MIKHRPGLVLSAIPGVLSDESVSVVDSEVWTANLGLSCLIGSCGVKVLLEHIAVASYQLLSKVLKSIVLFLFLLFFNLSTLLSISSTVVLLLSALLVSKWLSDFMIQFLIASKDWLFSTLLILTDSSATNLSNKSSIALLSCLSMTKRSSCFSISAACFSSFSWITDECSSTSTWTVLTTAVSNWKLLSWTVLVMTFSTWTVSWTIIGVFSRSIFLVMKSDKMARWGEGDLLKLLAGLGGTSRPVLMVPSCICTSDGSTSMISSSLSSASDMTWKALDGSNRLGCGVWPEWYLTISGSISMISSSLSLMALGLMIMVSSTETELQVSRWTLATFSSLGNSSLSGVFTIEVIWLSLFCSWTELLYSVVCITLVSIVVL